MSRVCLLYTSYLLTVAGKREDSEEIKLRLYDRLPYEVMLGVTMFADFMEIGRASCRERV